ncbi:MAG: DEAD/DEAH box helicase, partial [Aeromonas sp.]|nr:DEAD/DEAH box helicase [Aeromonas sp.]
DEADRLLEMGFWPDIQWLLNAMPTERQTLLFSATLPLELESLAIDLLTNPIRIEANPLNSLVSEIEERLHLVNKSSKVPALISLLKAQNWPQVLVFISARDDADGVARKLAKAGIAVAALHGEKDQGVREQALADFKGGKVRVLVATDLMARGIHVEALPVVINLDLPANAPVYVHRIGRTARAGQKGLALSLVCHGEAETLAAIRTLTGRALPLEELEGFPVTDQPASGEGKRAPRDKQANRRTQAKRSVRQFKGKA